MRIQVKEMAIVVVVMVVGKLAPFTALPVMPLPAVAVVAAAINGLSVKMKATAISQDAPVVATDQGEDRYCNVSGSFAQMNLLQHKAMSACADKIRCRRRPAWRWLAATCSRPNLSPNRNKWSNQTI
jgi:hypothetical protein